MMRRVDLSGFDKWVYRELLNISTYRGCFRFLGVAIIATYVMWHTHDFYAWFDGLFGIEKVIDPGRQAWARVWAVIIGGTGILTPIAAMITLTIERRRARKSAVGQWFDRPDLTREELYEDSFELPEIKREACAGMPKSEESKKTQTGQGESRLG